MEMKNLVQSILTLIALVGSATGAEEVIYAQVGEKVTLKAPVVADSGYIYWFFNGKQLAWQNPYGGKKVEEEGGPWKGKLSIASYSLVIDPFQEGFFGTFDVRLEINTVHTTFTVFKLNASMSPSSPLLYGDSMSLSCTVETSRGYRNPEIYWLDPQENKIPNNRLVRSTTGEHNGQWTCVVTDHKTEKKAKLSVVIIDLAPAPPLQYTSVSSPLTVPCSLAAHISWAQIKEKAFEGAQWHFSKNDPNLVSANPQRLFYLSPEDNPAWKKDQDKGFTPPRDLNKGKLSLSKSKATEDNRGYYTCALKFKNGVTLSRTVRVEVLQITFSPRTQLISGQQLNLSCSLGRPLPSDMKVKWLPPSSSSLSLQQDLHPTQLIIQAMGKGDGGSWRCELWQNGTLLTAAEVALKIEPRLSVWMLVIICSVTVIILLLLIVVFILYRRRQMKQQHRHFCRCKNPKPKGFYTT